MPHDYLTAVKKGYFHQVPMMMGTILNDGALMFPELEYGQFWETDGARFLFIRHEYLNIAIFISFRLIIA